MGKTYTLDRIENGEDKDYAILISDNGKDKIEIEKTLVEELSASKIKEGDAFILELDGTVPLSIKLIEGEGEKRDAKAKKRLSDLFNRKK